MALKDNPFLNKSVVTGILRVSKESIFSDLNNPAVSTILDDKYSQHFGLLEVEVKAILSHYQLDTHFDEVKAWYNGYQFGPHVMYNPWSVISYIYNEGKKTKPYWLNTSSNLLVHQLVTTQMPLLQKGLEALLSDKKIESIIDDQIVFQNLDTNLETTLSFLLFSGYLKATNRRKLEDEDVYDVEIPNREVKILFRQTVLRWMEQSVGQQSSRKLRDDLLKGNVDGFLEEVHKLVKVTLSFHDTTGNEPEIAYHMLILGMIAHVSGDYHIRSNREAGLGRYDVSMEPIDPNQLGYIFELKAVNNDKDSKLQEVQKEALNQIISKHYTTDMQARGIKRIACIALVFRKKELHPQFKVLE